MRVRLLSIACTVAVMSAMPLAACRHTPRSARAVITVDGSSTVYPLTEAIAEDFQRVSPTSHVTIGVAGTSGGLRRLCRGVLDMAAASRPIVAAEAASCAAAGIAFVELPVAFDGITVAVHPSNTWVESLTVDDLRRLWRHEAEGTLLRWSQLRPTYPDREVHLFGAGVESGTFDYFTGAITGAPRDSRGDYTSSEDDNTLVQGVAGDPNALGYFGFAYYEAHDEYVRAVAIRADATHGRGPADPRHDPLGRLPSIGPSRIRLRQRALAGSRRRPALRRVLHDARHRGGQRRRLRAARRARAGRGPGTARGASHRLAVCRRDAGAQTLTLAARLGVE